MFKNRLKKAMQELNLTQVQLAGMTGKSKASISQYLSGSQIPPEKVQREIAASLGLDADYFSKPEAAAVPLTKRAGAIRRLSVADAAKILGVDVMTVCKGLRQGVFPWGYAVNTSEKRWKYIINADRFSEIEGVAI